MGALVPKQIALRTSDEPALVERQDGSFLVAGWMPADECSDRFRFRVAEDADYQAIAGIALDEFKHLPVLGEAVEKIGYRFEVIDLDRRRIDKVLVTKVT